MGLECGAPRPQALKEKVELSKLDHGESMMPTQIARLLTFWDMASVPVWMSNMPSAVCVISFVFCVERRYSL